MNRKDYNRILIAICSASASRHCKLAVVRNLAAALAVSEPHFDSTRWLASADLMLEALQP